MKTLALAATTIGLLLTSSTHGYGSIMIYAENGATGVTFTATGSINTAALTKLSGGPYHFTAGAQPNYPSINMGTIPQTSPIADGYKLGVAGTAGPERFGSGNFSPASSHTGKASDRFSLIRESPSSSELIFLVDPRYQSGASLYSKIFFLGTNLRDMGVNMNNRFVWTFSTGETIELRTGGDGLNSPAAPEPGSAMIFAALAGCGALVRRRRSR